MRLDARDLVAALEAFIAIKVREMAPGAQIGDAADMVRARLDLAEVLRALLRMEIAP